MNKRSRCEPQFSGVPFFTVTLGISPPVSPLYIATIYIDTRPLPPQRKLHGEGGDSYPAISMFIINA
jgi:hypothetical protein